MTTVVVLGAGFGGLELASSLSDEFGDGIDVTLIDKNDSFVLGYSKLDVMFGRRSSDEVRMHYTDLVKPGVAFRRETVTSIDPAGRRVETDKGAYEADYLVIALGADYDYAATEGLDAGYEFYSVAGAERAKQALDDFGGGRVLVSMLGPVCKCPPALYEAAFHVHDLLRARGLRGQSSITVTTPLPTPIPVAASASDALLKGAAERGIDIVHDTRIVKLDAATQVATAEDGRTFDYDLVLAVPVHKAPDVVSASGLTVNGWVEVDAATMATKFPGVFAVGDVVTAPNPKAGAFAEHQARLVAAEIIAEVRNSDPPPKYAGVASCFVEFGDEGAGRVQVDFEAGRPPSGVFIPPSPEITAEKTEFGAARRRRWFSGS